MAFYYVKSGGTASGDAGRATSKRTGSFAAMGVSAYYASITAALSATTAPAAGDFIFCSSLHAGSLVSATVPAGVDIISVNDTAADQYAKGAAESSGASTLSLVCAAGSVNVLRGMILTGASAGLLARTSGGGVVRFDDCDVDAGRAGDSIFNDTDGITCEYINTDLILRNSPAFRFGENSRIVFDGCYSSGTAQAKLCSNLPNGSTLEFYNTRVDQLISANLFDDVTTGAGRYNVVMRRCTLPVGFSPFDAPPALQSYRIDIAQCTNPATPDHNAYHYFYFADPSGEVEEDLATYLAATYDGSNGFSALFSSSANCSPHRPLRYLIGLLPAQDLTAAKTITVDVTSDAGLTDNDAWIEVEVPDNTDNALGVVGSTQNADPIAAGSALPTAGAGAWTNADAASYLLSYDIGALAAISNGLVAVYGCVGKASIDANFDLPQIGAT